MNFKQEAINAVIDRGEDQKYFQANLKTNSNIKSSSSFPFSQEFSVRALVFDLLRLETSHPPECNAKQWHKRDEERSFVPAHLFLLFIIHAPVPAFEGDVTFFLLSKS